MNTAIIVGASTGAAIAQAQAREAESKACMAYVRGYDHERATVEEMRSYAGCIDRLHPEPMSADAITAWKVMIVILFVGVVIGIVRSVRNRSTFSDGVFGAVLFGCISGFIVTFIGILAVAGVCAGVAFLMS